MEVQLRTKTMDDNAEIGLRKIIWDMKKKAGSMKEQEGT